jgi:hypothetical protein
LVLTIEGADAFGPPKRCQSCGMADSFVQVRLTRAPAAAASCFVSKRIPSPWLGVLICSAVFPLGLGDGALVGATLGDGWGSFRSPEHEGQDHRSSAESDRVEQCVARGGHRAVDAAGCLHAGRKPVLLRHMRIRCAVGRISSHPCWP